jgi:hypothetical protein
MILLRVVGKLGRAEEHAPARVGFLYERKELETAYGNLRGKLAVVNAVLSAQGRARGAAGRGGADARAGRAPLTLSAGVVVNPR